MAERVKESKKRNPRKVKKSPKEAKREERKALYERNKLPKMTLAVKRSLDLEKMERQAREMTGTRRSMMMARIHFEKKRRKSERRRARNEAEARGEVVERQVPLTIESMRRPDDTIVDPDDVEVAESNEVDEFQDFYEGKQTPKIMMTTGQKPSKKLILLLKELTVVFPNTFYRKREAESIKDLVTRAVSRGYTELMVFVEKHKKPYGVYISHLPEGPTCFYRFSGLVLGQDIRGGAVMTTHNPEVIMKNFDTRLGQRIGRHLRALFPLDTEYDGRRVVVWHNQRDFVFFRHFRYIFDEQGEQAQLQEIGPRFTLKLYFVQEGTLNLGDGKFEYCWRPDMQVDRKTFFI